MQEHRVEPQDSSTVPTRDGKGLEDLGIGICHAKGVGWKNNVTVDEILGVVTDLGNGLNKDTVDDED